MPRLEKIRKLADVPIAPRMPLFNWRDIKWLLDRVDELRKTIGPFAEAANHADAAISKGLGPDSVGIWTVTSKQRGTLCKITVGDLLRAREALSKLEE